MKTAQAIPRAKKNLDPFPDYSRSLVAQRWRDPEQHGRNVSIGSGVLGAALGLAIARVLSKKHSAMALGAGLGAVAGAVPGYSAGRQEAESENSRILFLRRRLGINDPGEYESLLRFPERPLGAIVRSKAQAERLAKAEGEPEEAKEASVSTAYKAITTALKSVPTNYYTVPAGLALGYAGGHEIMPRLGGYYDDTQARRISGSLGGLSLAFLAQAMGLPPGSMAKKKLMMMAATGAVSGELVPTAVKTLNNVSDSTATLASATAANADRNFGGVLRDAVLSPTAKGMAVGAGAAGLGALATGLTRAKTDEEIREGKGRPAMVGRDFLRYVIPALAAGGAIGSTGSR